MSQQFGFRPGHCSCAAAVCSHAGQSPGVKSLVTLCSVNVSWYGYQ